MNVKRYEWVACDEHACHYDVVESAEGDMVDYEDYAALEARCAALAAENTGLKVKGRELLGEACAVYAKFNKLIDPAIGDYIDGQTLHEFQYVLDCETPATDAFLAEVRAQGVEMFAAVLRRKGDDAFFDAIAEAQANAADQFAAQLRKGVQ